MGEKINEVATGGAQVAQTSGGSGTTTAPPTDDGWGEIGKRDPGATAQQGGGSQADQEKDKTAPTGEITFPDGSRTRVTEDGAWEHTDASGRTGRWSSDNNAYWDPQTNEWMPEGWGEPGFRNRDAMTASDWEAWAGRANDARRMAQESGSEYMAGWWEQSYNEAVTKARELRSSEGRG